MSVEALPRACEGVPPGRMSPGDTEPGHSPFFVFPGPLIDTCTCSPVSNDMFASNDRLYRAKTRVGDNDHGTTLLSVGFRMTRLKDDVVHEAGPPRSPGHAAAAGRSQKGWYGTRGCHPSGIRPTEPGGHDGGRRSVGPSPGRATRLHLI